MNILSSVLRLVTLGIEYKGAIQAAVDHASAGASATEVIRTFAANTGTDLDDKAVEALINFVEDLQKKLPEIDKSKDELLEAVRTYWPAFRTSAHQILETAEHGLPKVLSLCRSLLEGAEARVEDIEGLFAAADIAIQILEEQIGELTHDRAD